MDETHYDRQGAVIDEKVLRKATITNFGGNDDSPQIPSRGSPVHNGVHPLPVLDYEHSPGQLMNGMTNDLTGLQQRYEMHRIGQRSPPMHRIGQRSPPMHLRQDMTDTVEFSQGTSSTTDVNSYNSDGEEESNFSDGASNMNTSIPCCFKDEHVSDMHRYGPPPSHAPLYLHHSPHMPSPNGLLGVIHPGNMSSLAADGSYRTSQGNGYTSNGRHGQDHSMSDSSSQTTIPSPHSRHEILNRMEPAAMRPKHSNTNGHGYPRPALVMPDAYPVAGLPETFTGRMLTQPQT